MLCLLCYVCRYAQVLRENPQSPPEVRLGLAACLYRGGKLERASAAYKRYGILLCALGLVCAPCPLCGRCMAARPYVCTVTVLLY